MPRLPALRLLPLLLLLPAVLIGVPGARADTIVTDRGWLRWRDSGEPLILCGPGDPEVGVRWLQNRRTV